MTGAKFLKPSLLLVAMVKKPVKVPLASIHPTEYLIPGDKLEEIAGHYDGTPESIKPVYLLKDGKRYYPENGNKRSLFLTMNGKDYILAYVKNAEENPDDRDDLKALAQRAESHGVNTLDDLKDKIVSRAEFERLKRKTEK
jgi:hypothetical protein